MLPLMFEATMMQVKTTHARELLARAEETIARTQATLSQSRALLRQSAAVLRSRANDHDRAQTRDIACAE